MVPLFTVTLFVSAALLFLVQPMFAKMILPTLGGAPAVWNTCLLFFQAALLAGYVYAHASVAWLGARRQAAAHLVVLLAPLAVLPIAAGPRWTPPALENPSWWLLGRLLVSVGPPFFVVAASAPLLQRWLAATSHRDARDPYFLYAASNLGSILALLAYPLAVEPWLPLRGQRVAWSYGYVGLTLLIAACAVAVWRSPRLEQAGVDHDREGGPLTPPRVTWPPRLRWVALAAVPSSLMLSVTTYISMDIAAIPLLWIIPLTLYLLTFVLVFARRPPIPHRWMAALLPLAILPPVLALAAGTTDPAWLLIPLHLLAFVLAAMVCHGEMARSRPAARDLTDFYLWMSAGGMVGGVFNVLVAPLVFTSAAEYPLGIVLACLLRPPAAGASARPTRFDLLIPIGLGLLVLPLAVFARALDARLDSLLGLGLIFGVPLIVCAAFWPNPRRFGIGLGAILLAGHVSTDLEGRVLHADRNFFGINRVMIDPDGAYRLFIHGSTIHGMQALDPARAREPLSYFHRTGPFGQLFASFEGPRAKRRIAVLGLGAGTMACYATAGQEWTFYEINPAVERLARDARYFSFIRDCLPSAPVVLGDARFTIARARDAAFDVIVFDAFSSDAIPIHLMTSEALEIYLRKLAPGGVLAFNISNRYLNLRPALGSLARSAGLAAIVQEDDAGPDEWRRGKYGSVWVVMARRRDDLGPLPRSTRWSALAGPPGATPWTDDFSNLVTAFKWLN